MIHLAAFVAVLAFIVMEKLNSSAPNSQQEGGALPRDPAGRRARAWTAITSQNLKGMKPAPLYFQARLETGDFSSAAYFATRSLFNRHVGSGKGDWRRDLAAHMTPSGEPLRTYDSPEQSVRDLVQLLTENPALYGAAYMAACAGDVKGYAVALAHGDGKVGFVGPAGTAKAAGYVAGIVNVAMQGVPV